VNIFAVCYRKNGFAEVSQNLDIDLKIILLDQNDYVEELIIMLQNVLTLLAINLNVLRYFPNKIIFRSS